MNFFSFIEIDKEKIDYSKENNNIKEKLTELEKHAVEFFQKHHKFKINQEEITLEKYQFLVKTLENINNSNQYFLVKNEFCFVIKNFFNQFLNLNNLIFKCKNSNVNYEINIGLNNDVNFYLNYIQNN